MRAIALALILAACAHARAPEPVRAPPPAYGHRVVQCPACEYRFRHAPDCPLREVAA